MLTELCVRFPSKIKMLTELCVRFPSKIKMLTENNILDNR